jgi:hypothetical protein
MSETTDKTQVPPFVYMTTSEQNRLSILNIQAELLTIHAKIDKILEALKQ